MGIKYHSEGIGKNKKIRMARRKPLPLQLMIDVQWQREKEEYLNSLDKKLDKINDNPSITRNIRRGIEKNPFDSEII